MQSVLLSDHQIQQFLIDGYIILEPSQVPEDLHKKIYSSITSIDNQSGNPGNNPTFLPAGNNILPKVPEIQKVFDDPVIHGALESLLGKNYGTKKNIDSK